jgi:hypothetical protein
MSNYTKTVDFAAKDELSSGSSGKLIRGTEFGTEFDNIATAIATKANTAGATLTGTTTYETLNDGTTALTSTVAELNILDGVTSTAAELNILDGVTSTAAELNILDGVTSTTAELNILDGVTSTATELNLLDGVTGIADEDNMASDSATKLATQQSIKAYVDAQVATVDTLAEVLANGNATDGTNVVVTAGDVITTDTISETTAAAGVTIDSVLLKDDGVNATNLEVTNIKANDGTSAGSIADSTGIVTLASSVLTTADINAGTIDNTVIGGTTAAAGSFTTGAFSGEIAANGGIALGDSDKATFGDGDDLQIYHTGTYSLIADTSGTGPLRVVTNAFQLNNAADTQNMLAAAEGGAVTLYYNGSTKLATTATGIDVTGTVTATGTSVFASLDISGDIDVDGTTNLDVVDIDGAVDMASTALVTGVLTTTAATVFNGGFASNDTSTIIAVDGAADNTYALQIKNQEATDDRSYGVLIQAGSTSNDAPLNITTHDGGTSLFTLVGSGQARFVNGTAGAPSVSFLTDLDTGFYRVGTNSIGFSTAGVARFIIASDGSLYTPTLGTSNVRFGVNAGNSIIAGGNYNVVVGDEAGTAITTGDANVFVGYASGDATTTGQYNVAMGHDALTTNTTGANNTAVGTSALGANTTASNNTAVGYASLTANTTGTGTAVGDGML